MPTSRVVAESRRRPRSVETRIFFRIGTVLWGRTAPLTMERPRARSSCLHFSLREEMSELESVTGFGNPTVVIEAMSFLNTHRNMRLTIYQDWLIQTRQRIEHEWPIAPSSIGQGRAGSRDVWLMRM